LANAYLLKSKDATQGLKKGWRLSDVRARMAHFPVGRFGCEAFVKQLPGGAPWRASWPFLLRPASAERSMRHSENTRGGAASGRLFSIVSSFCFCGSIFMTIKTEEPFNFSESHRSKWIL
jgi:hypothetical protein